MPLTSADRERYSRHLRLAEIGVAGQEKLRAARVAVVGAGGLGSPAALYLAAAGVGQIGIIDGDRVELSNLQRQILFDTKDVAQLKARVAGRRLAALNPEIEITVHAVELCADNVAALFGPYDLIVDGTDRTAVRYLINDACVILRKSLVCAAIHGFDGQAMSYIPGRSPCYRCLFPDATAAGIESCAEAGVLGALPGVLGAIQATEAVKIILGRGEPLLGRLLTYDALDMRFTEFPFARRGDCAVCGDSPRITSIQDRLPMRNLSPVDLARLLDRAGSDGPVIRLVDVREPAEYSAGHLAGALSIPLGELERVGSLPAGEGLLVFVCRSGGRSARACAIAAGRGVAELAHLEGGLLAWAATIDPSLHVA